MPINLNDFTVTSVLDFIDVAMVIVVILIIYYLLRLLLFLIRALGIGGHGEHPYGAHPHPAHPGQEEGGWRDYLPWNWGRRRREGQEAERPGPEGPEQPGQPEAIVIHHVVPNTARQDQGRVTLRVEGEHLNLLRRLSFPFHADARQQNLHLVSDIRDLTADHFEIDVDVSTDHAGHPTNLGMYDVLVTNAAGTEYRLDNAFEITAIPAAITFITITPASHPQGSGLVVLRATGTNFNLIQGNPVFHLHGNPAQTITVHDYTLVGPTEFDVEVAITAATPVGHYDIVARDAAGTEYQGDNLYEVTQGRTSPPPPPPVIRIDRVTPDHARQDQGIIFLNVIGDNFQLFQDIHFPFHDDPTQEPLNMVALPFNFTPTRFTLRVNVSVDRHGHPTNQGMYDIVILGPGGREYRLDNAFEITSSPVPPPPPIPPPGTIIRIDRVTPDHARQDEGVITLRVEGEHLDLLHDLHFPFHADPTQQPLNMATAPYNETPTYFYVDVNVSVDHHGNPTNLGMYDIIIADAAGTEYRLNNAFKITPRPVPPQPPIPPPGTVIQIDRVVPDHARQDEGIITLRVEGAHLDLLNNLYFPFHADHRQQNLQLVSNLKNLTPDHFEIDVDVSIDLQGNPTNLGMYDVVIADVAGTEYRLDNAFEITKGKVPEFTLSIIVQRRIDGVRINSTITINSRSEFVKDGFAEYPLPTGKYRVTSKPEDMEYKPITKVIDFTEDTTVEFVHDKKTDLKRNLGFLFEIAHFIESVLLVELERQNEIQRTIGKLGAGNVDLTEARKLIRDLRNKLTRTIDLGIIAFERFPPQDDEDRERIKRAISYIYSMRAALDRKKPSDKDKRYGLATGLEDDPYLALKLEQVIKQFKKFSRGLNRAERRVDRIIDLIKGDRDGKAIVISGMARDIFGESPTQFFRDERKEKFRNQVKIGAAIRKKISIFNSRQQEMKRAEDSGDNAALNSVISQMVKSYRDEARRARKKGNVQRAENLEKEIERLNTRRR